ncbi:MAG: DUF3575 domain-containing protein [Bacteroidetes bacterium]|nr:DUF3575 domain-containing protein [Bacteroidota bacterium]
MKKAILLLVVIIGSIPSFSQDAGQINTKANKSKITVTRKNVVKLNTLAIAFRNVSLIYERSIRPRLSTTLGLSYKFSGREPKVLKAENYKINIDMGGITGFSITPTLRYYIKTCDPSILDGFYVEPYLRYTHFQSRSKIEYLPTGGSAEYIESNTTLDEAGIGFQIGYQLVICKRFHIDFIFLGPRYSRYFFNYQFDGNVTGEFLDDLSDYINEVIDRFGYDYSVKINPQGSKKANADFGFTNVRFGLSIGYSF